MVSAPTMSGDVRQRKKPGRTRDLLGGHALVLGEEASPLLLAREETSLACTTDTGACGRKTAIGRLSVSLGVSCGFRRDHSFFVGRVHACVLSGDFLATLRRLSARRGFTWHGEDGSTASLRGPATLARLHPGRVRLGGRRACSGRRGRGRARNGQGSHLWPWKSWVVRIWRRE